MVNEEDEVVSPVATLKALMVNTCHGVITGFRDCLLTSAVDLTNLVSAEFTVLKQVARGRSIGRPVRAAGRPNGPAQRNRKATVMVRLTRRLEKEVGPKAESVESCEVTARR